MRILLIEDKKEKIDNIHQFLKNKISAPLKINIAKCLKEASDNISREVYDLIIFDIFLPITGENALNVEDVSSEIINEFTKSRNYQTEAIVITEYQVSDIENLALFNEKGVTVVHYSAEDSEWKDSLSLIVSRALNKVKYDFLIFCALGKERLAYNKTDADMGDLVSYYGMDCQEIRLDSYNGLCVLPAKMGLVNMAISASKAIELFQPAVVSMSGICGGVKSESNLLDVIVGNICWEYQTGKFKNNRFIQEPYQSNLEHHLELELKHFIESNDVNNEIKKGLYDTELEKSNVIIAPISSGSAVIADSNKMAEIGMQHRKMAGVEMEMYSLYEAANQSLCKPLFFGAKSVVDHGDSSKGDSLHTTASIISARFVVKFLVKKLNSLLNE